MNNDMNRRALLLFFLITLSITIGCQRSSDELAPIQGEWQFDEPRYLESLRNRSGSADDFKRIIDVYEMGKTRGLPVMTDVSIVDARIITTRGMIQQQFDLSDWNIEDGRIKAKAVWQKGGKDSGESRTVDVVLQSDGFTLMLTVRDGGIAEMFPFKKKL
jgi:hypothetical protein